MGISNPKADEYVSNTNKWKAEVKALRKVLLSCDLYEEIKWGKLCYSYGKTNVAIVYELKETAGIGFFKGALMKDPNHIMVSPGENSQAVKMIKFKQLSEIESSVNILKNYIDEAIQIEESGLKIQFKEKEELKYPEELLVKFAENRQLEEAFERLTPGRKRAYNLFFTAPKYSQTRVSRIEKHIDRIVEGKGLAD